MDDFAASLFA
jgi:hypothetical protein